MSNHNSIVLVDDESDLREICAEILKMRGYKVDQYGSAHLAMERLKSAADLLITDVQLPEISGIEMARILYHDIVSNNKPKIPILFISGQSHENLKISGIDPQHIFHLTKPFMVNALIEIVGQILARSIDSKAG